MKKFRILKSVFLILVLILSHQMCWNVGYNYASLLCAGEHKGFSAPAELAFLFAIPNAIGIVVCLVLAIVFYKKEKKCRVKENRTDSL